MPGFQKVKSDWLGQSGTKCLTVFYSIPRRWRRRTPSQEAVRGLQPAAPQRCCKHSSLGTSSTWICHVPAGGHEGPGTPDDRCLQVQVGMSETDLAVLVSNHPAEHPACSVLTQTLHTLTQRWSIRASTYSNLIVISRQSA